MLLLMVAVVLGQPAPSSAVHVSGELRQWHRVTLTVDGPDTSETAPANPFRNYRFEVEFTQGGRRLVVPGFFAADGNAAETGAEAGNQWQAHFTPDTVGEWTYRVSFRSGVDCALADSPEAGRPVAPHGARGTFRVGPTNKSGRDHRAKGLLRYVGEHYLQFAGTGEYFLKGGADSPENFLAYVDFDGQGRARSPNVKSRKGEARPKPAHRYQPHEADWRPGDPGWRDGRGRGIIGALNYLAAQGMNSVYFLTMNVGGDGKDVWPWIAPDVRDRFDCSKLAQWEIVFQHMDRQGIALHVITQEQENDQLLDEGALGPERRLYYRELIARFGHHPAVAWNLGEENTNTDEQRGAFCRYIRRIDPYDHPIVMHTFPGKYEQIYTPLLGNTDFCGPSLQMGDMKQTHRETLAWVRRSAEAGRKWVVCLDEIGPAHTGVKPDKDDPGHDEVRRHALWGNLMAGGAGAEWYFGYRYAHNDLNCEDWRSRQAMWDQTRHALVFFQQYLPFPRMASADRLTPRDDDYVFALHGEVYTVYLPEARTTDLRLPEGRFSVKWYDPRRGGPLADGSVTALRGPGSRSLGQPPREPHRDWAVLLRSVKRQPRLSPAP